MIAFVIRRESERAPNDAKFFPPNVVFVDSNNDVIDLTTLFKTARPEHFISRRDFERRNLSTEFLSAAIPAAVLFVILALVFAMLLCFKRQGEREEHWRGFVESFFLVVQVSRMPRVLRDQWAVSYFLARS